MSTKSAFQKILKNVLDRNSATNITKNPAETETPRSMDKQPKKKKKNQEK